MAPSVRATLQGLESGRHDLLVIGGGITGAGIARDAALRGMAVTLVEAGDFGSGTSSRSSRLIHGGLRYLEQRRFHLVSESLRERSVLLRLAPHLVRPIEFILPFYRGDRVPGWKVRLGLTLYDLLAGTGNVRRHQKLGKRALKETEPLLRERGLTGGARYFDAQCDDARLTVAVVRAAAYAGAKVSNYIRVTDLIRDGSRIIGARLRDELSGQEGQIEARLVINATGPWTDAIRRMEEPRAEPVLHLTKGSHVQIAQSRIGNKNAILFNSPIDRRPMFVLPWGDWTYIGTTEVSWTGPPDSPEVSEGEMVYLLRSANSLFPEARLGLEDVTASWSALRPLIATQGNVPPGRISREHRILKGPRGMLTIAGGKLTTFRRMAELVVDQASKEIGMKTARLQGESRAELLPGTEGGIGLALRAPGAKLGLSGYIVDYLIRHYGAETPVLYDLCRERSDLMERIHPSHPAIGAQVRFALEREFACTAADILERRIRLNTETADQGAAAKAKVQAMVSGYFSTNEAPQ